MFLKVITLPLLAVVGYAKVVPVPDVPYITPDQQSAIDAAASLGKAASAEGRQQLLELMQRPMFKTYLKQMADRPELINMKPEDVITNLGLQYQASEVVHNWHPYNKGSAVPGLRDISLDTSVPYKTFFQGWQLGSLGLASNNSIGKSSVDNWCEMSIFNFPNFTTPSPDYVQASTRVIYGALNIRKLSTGNRMFGPISSVFKNSRMFNVSTIFGVDSGMYSDACGPPFIPKFLPGFEFNCSAFQPVGNFEYWEHTVLANVLLTNMTGGYRQKPVVPQSLYPEFNMAYLVATFLNEDYSKMKPVIASRVTDYIEANLAVNVQWNTDIKMIILSFRRNLFGTGTADTLRQWAISNNWVVVWANDFLDGAGVPGSTLLAGEANQRILDPFVLSQISAGRNSTSDKSFPDLVKTFDSLWEVVNQTLPKLAPNEVVDFYWSSWNTTWDAFKGTVLEVQPLSGTSCANNDCAVVRVIDKKCICE